MTTSHATEKARTKARKQSPAHHGKQEWRGDVPLPKRIEIVTKALITARGNRSKAAIKLGMERTTLVMFIDRHAAELGLLPCDKCGAMPKIPSTA